MLFVGGSCYESRSSWFACDHSYLLKRGAALSVSGQPETGPVTPTCFGEKMKILFSVLVFLSAANIAFAQKPATVKAECRKVLEQNFEACNEKDLKGLVATCSRYTGTRAQGLEFMREAQKMFDETSVIMRVEKMELLSFDPPEAVFLVRQSTLPNNESDHKPKGPTQAMLCDFVI